MLVQLGHLPLLEVSVLDKPLAKYLLSMLRRTDTDKALFRELLEYSTLFLLYEASKDLPMEERQIRTPLAETHGIELRDSDIVVIPILRAGLPMLNAVLKILKRAKVGFIAAKRIEHEDSAHLSSEFSVEISYMHIPKISGSSTIIVLDPMLATASTMCRVVELLAKFKPLKILILNIISAVPGIKRLNQCCNSIDVPVHVYTFTVDPELDSKGYIVPGLGDAGDRAFL